jgi:hypothetical protein
MYTISSAPLDSWYVGGRCGEEGASIIMDCCEPLGPSENPLWTHESAVFHHVIFKFEKAMMDT